MYCRRQFTAAMNNMRTREVWGGPQIYSLLLGEVLLEGDAVKEEAQMVLICKVYGPLGAIGLG